MSGTEWSVERYKQCRDFDIWMKEHLEWPHSFTATQLLEQNPTMARMWQAWVKQKREGTLNCPQWCERCEGRKWVSYELDGESYAKPCPGCKKPVESI